MNKKTENKEDFSEIGTVRKKWKDRIKIALVYPNTYKPGMSSLGFQTVYRLFNDYDHIVCERAFLPEKKDCPVFSTESRIRLDKFDIIAFSVSFENDYLNIADIIKRCQIPLFAKDRKKDNSPYIIAGGAACFLNPLPIAPFIDCILIGEAEAILPKFVETIDSGLDKESWIKKAAESISSAFVPEIFPTEDEKIIKRAFPADLAESPACTEILTSNTTFENTYLIELSRGCAHGCRFCSAAYIYKPLRRRPFKLIQQQIDNGLLITPRIGLMGAAVSDFPDLEKLCADAVEKKAVISLGSLRADAFSENLLSLLAQSGAKTVTVAPDAGSEEMRLKIKKGITEKDVLDAVQTTVEAGIPNIKLYFIIGLPGETDKDIEAIADLCKKVREKFLKASRPQKRIGVINVSISPFVPKPFTPFQWAEACDQNVISRKADHITWSLRNSPNLKVHISSIRGAYIQSLISRGDHNISLLLNQVLENKGNWPKTLKSCPINLNSYISKLSYSQKLPWSFIDHGTSKERLWNEYEKSL